MFRSQLVTLLLLLVYVVCGAVLCRLVLDRKHCGSSYYYFPVEEESADGSKRLRSYDDRFCAGGYHGVLSLIGTLVMGFTIIIYRLLIGTRTRVVKYLHMALHMVTFVIFGIGIWCIFSHEYSMTYDRIHFHGLHSWIVIAIFCVQIAVATITFTCLSQRENVRSCVTLFHDLLGIWLFISCVACCISGRSRAQVDYVSDNKEIFNGYSYMCFTIIMIVILSPFFEWDVVGPV